jgi:hypothetical protein
VVNVGARGLDWTAACACLREVSVLVWTEGEGGRKGYGRGEGRRDKVSTALRACEREACVANKQL